MKNSNIEILFAVQRESVKFDFENVFRILGCFAYIAVLFKYVSLKKFVGEFTFFRVHTS